MRFQIDKLKHLGIGLAVSCAVYAVTQDLAWTWGLTIAMAIGKEAWDATGRGHVEFRDFFATIIPAGLPTIAAYQSVFA